MHLFSFLFFLGELLDCSKTHFFPRWCHMTKLGNPAKTQAKPKLVSPHGATAKNNEQTHWAQGGQPTQGHIGSPLWPPHGATLCLLLG